MFTKRVRIIYAFLFLFAFTFALSFTLALAQPPVPECCIIYHCQSNPIYGDLWGHVALDQWGHPMCMFTGYPHPCDIVGICAD